MQSEAMDIFFSEVRQIAAIQLQRFNTYPGSECFHKNDGFFNLSVFINISVCHRFSGNTIPNWINSYPFTHFARVNGSGV